MEALYRKNGSILEPVITDFQTSTKGIKFKKELLVDELLSLGNSKITRQIAELVGLEVEKEIHARRIQFLSSELISELVAVKLEELGLISSPKKNGPSKPHHEEKETHPLVPDEPLETELLELMAPAETEDPFISPAALDFNNRKVALSFSKKACRYLEENFCIRDEQGHLVEDINQLLSRVARTVAEAEVKYNPMVDLAKLENSFYNLMATQEFLPEPLTLKQAGQAMGQLTSLYSLPVHDSTESIFESMKNAAIIHKKGGACGFSFSQIRPHRDIVHSVHGQSSGPVSFMKVYYAALQTMTPQPQGKKEEGESKQFTHDLREKIVCSDRAILNVDHPDILDFVSCKGSENMALNFKLSVGVTDAFMKAVEEDKHWSLINPRTGEQIAEVRARKIFKAIVEQAWKYGEPSLLFLDRIEEQNPTPIEGTLMSTNADGDQPLLPFETCSLGAINLSKMVDKSHVDWEKLKRVVCQAVHFLDNVLEVNYYALQEVYDVVHRNRKIGIGVMGWAEMLMQLGMSYSSEEALSLARQVSSFIQKQAEVASINMAEKRGVFPNYANSCFANKDLKRRHANLTAIFSTQDLHVISDCSPGIEPLDSLAASQYGDDNSELPRSLLFLKKMLEEKNVYSDSLFNQIKRKGFLKDFINVSQEIKEVFITSSEIDSDWHLRTQAVFQEYTENGVCKKISLDTRSTQEEVARYFILAHQYGVKSVTLSYPLDIHSYQYALFDEGQLRLDQQKASYGVDNFTQRLHSRPYVLSGITKKVTSSCGEAYLTFNEGSHGLFEVLSRTEKADCHSSLIETVSKLISLIVQYGVDPNEIVERLENIECHAHRDSFPNRLAIELKKYLHQRQSRMSEKLAKDPHESLQPSSQVQSECVAGKIKEIEDVPNTTHLSYFNPEEHER